MNVFYVGEHPNEKQKYLPSVFLAGGTIRRKTGKEPISWREEALFHLENMETELNNEDSWIEGKFENFELNIFVPEWKYYHKPIDWTYEMQIEWETKYLKESTKILFWIPRNLDTLPCFTTNIEFGEYLHSNKIAVGSPVNAQKNDYLKYRCSQNNIYWYNDLNTLASELADEICFDYKRTAKGLKCKMVSK